MTDNAVTGPGGAAVQAQPNTQPPPRLPRTHTNPTIIQLLKSLPLISKLQKNKEIEDKNAERALKTLNHTQDMTAFPDAGSEAASLVTLDPEDLDRFRVPSFALSFRDYIYSSLAKWIADEEIKDPKNKRKALDDPKITSDEARIAKRHCMNGRKLTPWIVGAPWHASFPQSLFDTEGCIMVPLSFFLNENLQILNVEASTLPTVKTNPNPGETKGISILDVEKLSVRFGRELSLDFSQWTEAAGNVYLFQKERDEPNTGDAHSEWYDQHFGFYIAQKDKVRLYDTWKADELKFRQEHWACYGEFKGSRYDQAFALSEKQHAMMAEIRDMMATNKTPSGRDNGNFPKSSLNSKYPPRRSSDRPSSSSFPPGSGRSSSSPSDCLICAERGHDSRIHNDTTTAVKFKDGKATWARCANRALVTPNNRVLCINWNVRGSNSICAHGKEERAHLCSFCGSKDHHALSWTCRPPPSN
ncbi:hypothetical protein BDZ97DRAFT_1772843 [Flammula alnicola]|nr:hypothetical protein BDZ97DRAFT_1772843 [Flammula alnicola]